MVRYLPKYGAFWTLVGLVAGLACAAVTLNHRFYLLTRTAKNIDTSKDFTLSTKTAELL